jgi:ribulose 1,5-bisphosphate synthetase/thiazole synthase
MIRSSYDAIVVGLGAAGSATLYHLANKGLKVTRHLTKYILAKQMDHFSYFTTMPPLSSLPLP